MALVLSYVLPTPQETRYTCGAASLRAVLQHYGVYRSEVDLAEVIGVTRESGATLEQIASGAKKLGFEAQVIDFPSIRALRQVTDKNLPVIANVNSWRLKDSGHHVVVTYVDGQFVYIMDPNGDDYLPNRRRLTHTEMWDSRWYRYGRHGGVVVLPRR